MLAKYTFFEFEQSQNVSGWMYCSSFSFTMTRFELTPRTQLPIAELCYGLSQDIPDFSYSKMCLVLFPASRHTAGSDFSTS